jgi:hypothetical protein
MRFCSLHNLLYFNYHSFVKRCLLLSETRTRRLNAKHRLYNERLKFYFFQFLQNFIKRHFILSETRTRRLNTEQLLQSKYKRYLLNNFIKLIKATANKAYRLKRKVMLILKSFYSTAKDF